MEAGMEEITERTDQVFEVAKQQKRLIWLILLDIILVIVIMALGILSDSGPSGYPPSSAVLGSVLTMTIVVSPIVTLIGAYLVFKICKALGMTTGSSVAYVVLLFLPCFRLVSLLYVNSSATKFLRENGVRVAFMGADKMSLSRLRESG